MVVVPAKYKALTFKPFRGEVLDAVVTDVVTTGFWCEAGPLQIFVSEKSMGDDWVSDETHTSRFVNTVSGEHISSDTVVRVRLLGISIDHSRMIAVASINCYPSVHAYLGVVVQDAEE
eukprot:GHVR01042059.1.p1 GENE.GHVR01042059.1~~GHVR01042059.1.p1  ORF type:complete len:118 (+),score=23.59 GHVR01042059.1:219-572(+)